MKNKTFISSIRCALAGLWMVLKQEKNCKTYFLHVVLTVPFNIYFHYSILEWIAYILCVCGVFGMECMNTAIERACDFLTEDANDKIKAIKDIAAGAVICMGFAFYITNIVLIANHLCA